MTTIHRYETLNEGKREIRLLHLLDLIDGAEFGFDAQCVRGRFECTHLARSDVAKEITPYAALSYVWGEPEFTSAVILDNGSYIPMSRNLQVAIHHIFDYWDAPNVLPIWIDAICMDQSNHEEKSWQVGCMNLIYACATTTLIFMGPIRDEQERLQLEMLVPMFRRVGDMATSYNFTLQQGDTLQYLRHAAMLSDHPPSPAESDMSKHEMAVRKIASELSSLRRLGSGLLSFKSILSRQWWQRVWVLQELFVSPAPMFLCGTHSLTGDSLLNALLLFAAIAPQLEDFSDTISTEDAFEPAGTIMALPHIFLHQRSQLHAECRASELKNNPVYPVRPALQLSHILLSFLDSRMEMRATDPRDHVYGILGLITVWIPENARIRPDYSKTVQEVYLDTASSLLQAGFNDVLRITISQTKRIRLPSWLPDFSARGSSTKMRPRALEGPFFHKLHTEQPFPALELKGHICGLVQALDTTIPSHSIDTLDMNTEKVSSVVRKFFLRIVAHIIVQRSETLQQSQRHIVAATLAIQRYMEAIDASIAINGGLRSIERVLLGWSLHWGDPSLSEQQIVEITRIAHPDDVDAEIEPADALLGFERSDDPLVCARMIREGALFLCNDVHWGASSNKIRTGDVVVRLEIDPGVLYVLRPQNETFELISAAAVPSVVDLEQPMTGPMRSFHLV